MKYLRNVTLGADPELFFERDGEILSAEGLVGGTKDNPRPISSEGHAIQEDNVMVEFNVPPTDSEDSFVDSIKFVKDYLTTLASVHGATLKIAASGNIPFMQSVTEQAQTFGCDPDFNAYTGDENHFCQVDDTTLRSCGGHIHIGFEDPASNYDISIIKILDMYLGLPSLLLDDDKRRRNMYGKAGAFRLKSYGIEYRTLSNFWIKDEESIRWAFNATMNAIETFNNEALRNKLIKQFSEQVREVIDIGDETRAESLLDEIKLTIEQTSKVKIEN